MSQVTHSGHCRNYAYVAYTHIYIYMLNRYTWTYYPHYPSVSRKMFTRAIWHALNTRDVSSESAKAFCPFLCILCKASRQDNSTRTLARCQELALNMLLLGQLSSVVSSLLKGSLRICLALTGLLWCVLVSKAQGQGLMAVDRQDAHDLLVKALDNCSLPLKLIQEHVSMALSTLSNIRSQFLEFLQATPALCHNNFIYCLHV